MLIPRTYAIVFTPDGGDVCCIDYVKKREHRIKKCEHNVVLDLNEVFLLPMTLALIKVCGRRAVH